MQMSVLITDYLPKKPKWLQYAINDLAKFGDLNEEQIDQLTKNCLKEVDGKLPNIALDEKIFAIKPNELNETHHEIQLCSISNIQGVNQLTPRSPLEFDGSDITIIYGENGSGKSSYIRLLKTYM